jgi:hypothetical protein
LPDLSGYQPIRGAAFSVEMAVLACLGIERSHLWNSGASRLLLEGVQLSESVANVKDRNAILRDIRVLDGGMASELEYRGANTDGPLWSAHVLGDAPEKVIAVHRAYIEAGAECILAASYQVSRMGDAEFGLAPDRADPALLRSVELAGTAVAEFPLRSAIESQPFPRLDHRFNKESLCRSEFMLWGSQFSSAD